MIVADVFTALSGQVIRVVLTLGFLSGTGRRAKSIKKNLREEDE